MVKAPCIWIDKPRAQRLTHVYFRRSFSLSAVPKRAVIHLYAQSLYHLRVNGVMVGYGPARAYNEYPEFDSYDITPYLRTGTNVIGVQVAHDGDATFHHLKQDGLFVAWGDIKADARTVSLSTASSWRCHRSRAHEPFPLPFSFAIGPVQMFDERKAPIGWDTPGTPAGVWEKPVVVEGALAGTPRKRTIPHLTQEEQTPRSLLGAWKHDMSEQVLSFSIPNKHFNADRRDAEWYTFAYTWIHSPRDQQVTLGTWWSEPALNGRLLTRTPSSELVGREEMTLALKKGWNFFTSYYRDVSGAWDWHLGMPRAAKLTVSAERSRKGKPTAMIAGPLGPEKTEAIRARWPVADPQILEQHLGAFRRVTFTEGAATPMRGIGWARFAEALPLPPHRTNDLSIEPGADTSLLIDMGKVTLGRIFVEFDAPRGTVIDITYTEELSHGRPNIAKSSLVNAGERHIARGGHSRMETFVPRGFRYLQIVVRNHRSRVHIERIGAVSQVYPYVKRGTFECSDPLFNTLWDYGWNTLRLCSEDVITDCPWRERTLYGGDLLAEMATAAVTSGDLRLFKRSITVFLQSQSKETGWLQSMAPMVRDRAPLYEYPVLVLVGAEWYCRLTGDVAFAKRCYPVFKRLMRAALETREPNGLFPTRSSVFIMHGYRTTTGQLCALNALFVRAFEQWGALLDTLERDAEAEAAREVARTTQSALTRRFWDSQTQSFADALAPDNPLNLHTVPANAWPLLFCSVSTRQRTGALAEIESRLDRHDPANEIESISPYASFYMLGSLYAHEREALAEDAMRRVYQPMLDTPTGTIWEQGHMGKSLTHAWSTAPNFYLSTRALGIRLGFPESAGVDEVVIAPQSETLSWARGAVPHPRGAVTVAWRIAGETLELHYTAPAGVTVTLAPRGRLAKLRLVAKRGVGDGK